jgi:hypothetical protein
MVAEAWCGHLCRVKANQGAVVRAGRALDSDLVGELPTGAEVRVWESGFHLKGDGTKIGRCRVTEPLNGWLSAKCVEVLPQGVRGGPVPRCDDYEACFEPAEPQRAVKKNDGPPKTYVPASIKCVVLNVPEEERNGVTNFKVGWAHGQTTVVTDKESRANTELYQWTKGKDGGPPELSARLSFHGFASRALPPGKTMKG